MANKTENVDASSDASSDAMHLADLCKPNNIESASFVTPKRTKCLLTRIAFWMLFSYVAFTGLGFWMGSRARGGVRS